MNEKLCNLDRDKNLHKHLYSQFVGSLPLSRRGWRRLPLLGLASAGSALPGARHTGPEAKSTFTELSLDREILDVDTSVAGLKHT